MTEAAQTTEPSLDLNAFFTPKFIANPYPRYKWLRENNPILKVPDNPLWILTRFSDIGTLLRDKRFGHDHMLHNDPDLEEHPSIRNLRSSMLLANPPTHTRLRSLVVKAFNAKAVEAMRPLIRALANDLTDKMLQTDGGDMVKMFNHPLPVLVICRLLGIPEEDWTQFTEGQFINGRLIDPTALEETEIAEIDQRTLDSQAYFNNVFERRRQEPKDDLLTMLVKSENEYGKLSPEELVANVMLLFAAGHETTSGLLGNGLLALHRNPEQLALLKKSPERVPAAVEEFLRYDSSVQLTGRTALEDAEINGHPIKKGEQIYALLGAANHDPEAFERPDELDIARKDSKYLSFGGGIHFCLGAQLARIEGAEAFKVILEKLPNLKITETENPDWKDTVTLRGLKTMPATW